MSKSLLLRLGLLFVLSLAASPASATHIGSSKTITIVADLWCPINCDPAAPHQGIGIDIARRIFEPLGYTVNYIAMPWARALSEVRAGDADAVIGANHNDDPTLIFPQNPIAAMTDDFYAAKDSNIVFTGVDSLKGLRLGIIHDYGYSDAVQTLIATGRGTPGLIQDVSGNNALEQNLKKLINGRIDVLIESRIVVDNRLRVLGLADQVQHLGGIPQGNVYLAFSQAVSDSKKLAQAFDEGMERLKKDRRLDALYASYGINP